MRKKTITIILALVLCLSLAVPAFAATHEIVTEYGEAVMSITNFTSQTTDTYYENYEGTDYAYEITLINANAPATVTVLGGPKLTWDGNAAGDIGSTIIRIKLPENKKSEDIEYLDEIPLATGEKVPAYEVYPEFSSSDSEYTYVMPGSTFVLEAGSYFINSSYAGDNFCIIVSDGSGTQTPPPSAPAPGVPTPPTSNDIKVLVNGTAVSFDQPPIIQNGRTLVPLRAIFEALGATVDYEPSTQTLTAVRENVTVIMQIGNSVFTVNGEQKTLDVAPQIIGGRTLVPARAIAESFGADVAWDQSTQTMTITMG